MHLKEPFFSQDTHADAPRPVPLPLFTIAFLLLFLLPACELTVVTPDGVYEPGTGGGVSGDTAVVTDVIDGDTIDVAINGSTFRVRYVGVNTPERDESCYREAVEANRELVEGQTVTLVRDTSDTDRYDRLLRYVYVGNTFVNQELVREGYAEVVVYGDDDQYADAFRGLEQQAARANRGCHASGIFDDGSYTR